MTDTINNGNYQELIDRIKKDLIETTYYDDIKYNIKGKTQWKTIGDVCEAVAHGFMSLSTVLAFSAGVFDNKILSFIAGSVGVLSFALLRFSSYATKESKERTDQVNLILDSLGIKRLTDIAVDSTMDDTSARPITVV